MNKLKTTLFLTFLLIVILSLLTRTVLANTNTISFKNVEYSESFKKWLELSEEEKANTIMPNPFERIIPSKSSPNNILFKLNLLKNNMNDDDSDNEYDMRTILNKDLNNPLLIIKNQLGTNSCWAFAGLSSLETNLDLADLRKGILKNGPYDFSERHMEYSNANGDSFSDGNNEYGYNRRAGESGHWYYVESYLTNGLGAVEENEMKFENNNDQISISKIQGKPVSTQVYDTVDFANYNAEGNNKNQIMNEIKEHIKKNGSVFASIHGQIIDPECYNSDTGALYCSSSQNHQPNHAISIIGWKDDYSVDNFAENAKPSSNGAWIVRNSWGDRYSNKLNFTLAELKQNLFENYPEQIQANGWNSADDIPNEAIEELGFIIEEDGIYKEYGDSGCIYVSYEDCNISNTLYGIEKASNKVDYDNIYQYDKYYPIFPLDYPSSEIMLCNIFDKKTTGKEYLTQVSLYAPETYTCKVYVNPNGDSKSSSDLQKVALKEGETETFNAGYHTIEFSKPIEITGEKFAVVVQISGTNPSTRIQLEAKINANLNIFDNVTTVNDRCFFSPSHDFDNTEWCDLGKLSSMNSSLYDSDSSIKAFTVSQLYDDSLTSIEIDTPPSKTQYFEGDNFDKAGMIIKANYNSKTNPSVILDDESYTITNGNDLKESHPFVTISYTDNGVTKSLDYEITVQKNSVINIEMKSPPTKTEYKEGQQFDTTGMVIEATFKNGTTKTITDYTVENGNNLKVNQDPVTISYGGKSIALNNITVIQNSLLEIRIAEEPNKTKYIVGQNFDKTGMKVVGIYQNGDSHEIIDYTVKNGLNLTIDQSSVEIIFEGKSINQNITVEEKSITNVVINKLPTKLNYYQNKDNIDLSGGSIKVSFNDNSYEEISLTSELVTISGYNNKNIGKNTITVTYQAKTTSFDVEIIAEPKPENSKFDTADCQIISAKYYTYTDSQKQDYFILDAIIDKIFINKNNDNYEYFYFLSSSQDEFAINDWVKITDYTSSDNKLQFKINSKDIKNYDKLLSSNNDLFLYVKEVAIKGSNQSVVVSKPMKINADTNFEFYLNDVEIDTLVQQTITPTNAVQSKAPGILPNTGIGSILIIVLVIVILGGTIFYVRYKFLNKYIK